MRTKTSCYTAVFAVGLLLLAQFVVADNTDFSGGPRDTDAWRSFSLIPLPNPLFSMLRPVRPVFLQPSLGILRSVWAPAIEFGHPISSSFGRWLVQFGLNHPRGFVLLIAFVNTIAWSLAATLVFVAYARLGQRFKRAA